jgi:hypothetical protein
MHTLPVEAWDRAQTKKLATGKLQTIDNQIDTTTGTVKLRALSTTRTAHFSQPVCEYAAAGEYAQRRHADSHGAVQHNGQVAFVYVIANGSASVRNITTGVADGGMTAVQGINPGEVVATSSFDKLQAGARSSCRSRRIAANPSGGQYSVNPSGPFIQRPVATSLLMAAILLVGIVAYTQLPVSALPEVDYPTIQVLTFYPGANP